MISSIQAPVDIECRNTCFRTRNNVFSVSISIYKRQEKIIHVAIRNKTTPQQLYNFLKIFWPNCCQSGQPLT